MLAYTSMIEVTMIVAATVADTIIAFAMVVSFATTMTT